MFTTEQVKGFILHPDNTVSNAALRYFDESFLYENDTTLMPLLLKRMSQTQRSEPLHLFNGYHFPQTGDTVRELIHLHQSTSTDSNTRFHLMNMLENCDAGLLESHTEWVEQHPKLKKQIEQKKSLAEMDDQKLLQTFKLFIEESSSKHVSEFDTGYGESIVNELSGRSCIDPEVMIRKMDNHSVEDPSYETYYYVLLAGRTKLEAAIPALCDLLGSDDDLLPEEAVKALIRIGTPQVISRLTEQYISSDMEYFRLFATDVFGKIKLPESEEALLRLLPEEQNLEYATKLADALCDLGSSKGFPLVLAMIEEGYAVGILNLTESIYAYCVISDTPHPFLPKWKKELDELERRMARRSIELERMFNHSAKTGQKSNPLNMLLDVKTYKNPEPKIGRNDPCPCGSGKKHKKCCGA